LALDGIAKLEDGMPFAKGHHELFTPLSADLRTKQARGSILEFPENEGKGFFKGRTPMESKPVEGFYFTPILIRNARSTRP